MTDQTIELDAHRGMAAQKATELRRLGDMERLLTASTDDHVDERMPPTNGE